MIVTTKRLIPERFAALTCWPFIFVRPEYREDTGLIEHELVHYREQRASWLLPWLLRYWLSKDFRMGAEVRGYRRQMEIGDITLQRAVDLLTKSYGLKLTELEAIHLLTKQEST